MRSASDECLRARFGHVTTWVFDLDNTLYPPDSGLWSKIDERITLFLVDLFGLDGQSARALHQHYYLRHGTTLRGLVEDNVDEAEQFLEFVHDIDRSALQPNPASRARSRAFPAGNSSLPTGHEITRSSPRASSVSTDCSKTPSTSSQPV